MSRQIDSTYRFTNISRETGEAKLDYNAVYRYLWDIVPSHEVLKDLVYLKTFGRGISDLVAKGKYDCAYGESYLRMFIGNVNDRGQNLSQEEALRYLDVAKEYLSCVGGISLTEVEASAIY